VAPGAAAEPQLPPVVDGALLVPRRLRLHSLPVNVVDLLQLPRLEDDLVELERSLERAVGVEDPFLGEIAHHLIRAGGKRIRPALVLSAAAISGVAPTPEVLLGGVAVELVHIASLYHDDVMDEAERRRTVPSVNARFGDHLAVVVGDFLLARAAEIAASLGTEVAGLLAHTLGRMCAGQVAEVQATFDPGRPESAYVAAVAGKTASLMACACRIGAITAGLGAAERDALTDFGEALGMVFQIRDDILDVVGDEAELGKAAGQDLAKGVYTLPVLFALDDPDAGPTLRRLLGRPLDPSGRNDARAAVVGSDGVTRAIAVARRWADEAARAAGRLGPGEVAQALVRLPGDLLDGVLDAVVQPAETVG